MPIYEYRCPKGHTFEAFQKMSDDPLSECEECGAPVERVFHPVAVHFKGSGFYTTDYGSKSKSKARDGGDPSASEGGSSSSEGGSSSSEAAPSSDSSSSGGGSRSKQSGGKDGRGEGAAKTPASTD
ncbi:MAG: FmdB family zinc ribbon protein [Solirubrobacterales bacterium]